MVVYLFGSLKDDNLRLYMMQKSQHVRSPNIHYICLIKNKIYVDKYFIRKCIIYSRASVLQNMERMILLLAVAFPAYQKLLPGLSCNKVGAHKRNRSGRK